jgi:hypothetical protein
MTLLTFASPLAGKWWFKSETGQSDFCYSYMIWLITFDHIHYKGLAKVNTTLFTLGTYSKEEKSKQQILLHSNNAMTTL